MIIVLELSKGEEVRPIILPLIDKEPEVLLQLLVDTFGLAISLGMVGGSGSQFNPEHPVKFSGELGHELGAPVRDYLARQAVVFPDILKKQSGRPGGCYGGEGGDEVGSFGDRVHYHHHGIVTGRLRQLDYEVYADSIPWSFRDWKGVKLSNWMVSLGLGPEAKVASGDISADVPGHLGPPIVPRHQLQSLPPAGVASHSSVVTEGDNAPAYVEQVGDIDLPSEVQEAV